MRKNKVRVVVAADLMGVRPQFIRIGLQIGKLPFGTAFKLTGNKRCTYYISPEKFSDYTGISLEKIIEANSR